MAMLKIHPADNVAVLLDPIRSGETLTAAAIAVTATAAIEQGHKIALTAIRQGERVVKYGFPIGIASCSIVLKLAPN